jgi:hypothetical protein
MDMDVVIAIVVLVAFFRVLEMEKMAELAVIWSYNSFSSIPRK